MDPAEVEFLAEKTLVTITPNFSLDKLYLISGDFGPFVGGMNAEVPLWLAVYLRQRQKCRIQPPNWMDVELLQEKKQEEIDCKVFTAMPCPHYMEITQLIFNTAIEDIPRADELRTLIKDIWDIRMSKLRTSVDVFVGSDSTHAKLNHLTIMEINTVRPLLTKVLDELSVMRSAANDLSTQRTLSLA